MESNCVGQAGRTAPLRSRVGSESAPGSETAPGSESAPDPEPRPQGSGSSRRRGSVMVELSLIFVLFSTLLIGIVDFGQFLFYQQGVVERVRAAARWGSVTDPTNATAITNVLLYNQSATPPAGTAAYFGLKASMVSVSTADAGTDDYRLVVRLSGYSFPVLSSFLAASYSGPPISVSEPLGLYY